MKKLLIFIWHLDTFEYISFCALMVIVMLIAWALYSAFLLFPVGTIVCVITFVVLAALKIYVHVYEDTLKD